MILARYVSRSASGTVLPAQSDADRFPTASQLLAEIRTMESSAVLETAARLGHFALGVACCAGADGLRIRVVALEPVTPLDLGVARLKLERWYPEAAGAIELAAAGCWR